MSKRLRELLECREPELQPGHWASYLISGVVISAVSVSVLSVFWWVVSV